MTDNWIAGAVPKANKGKFSAKAARAGETTSEYAHEKAGAKGKLGKEARLALVFEGAAKKHPMKKRYGA